MSCARRGNPKDSDHRGGCQAFVPGAPHRHARLSRQGSQGNAQRFGSRLRGCERRTNMGYSHQGYSHPSTVGRKIPSVAHLAAGSRTVKVRAAFRAFVVGTKEPRWIAQCHPRGTRSSLPISQHRTMRHAQWCDKLHRPFPNDLLKLLSLHDEGTGPTFPLTQDAEKGRGVAQALALVGVLRDKIQNLV